MTERSNIVPENNDSEEDESNTEESELNSSPNNADEESLEEEREYDTFFYCDSCDILFIGKESYEEHKETCDS